MQKNPSTIVRKTAILTSKNTSMPSTALHAFEARIGRGVTGENDILVGSEDARVSRDHARFFFKDNRWWLEDYSRNGTHVNDAEVHNSVVALETGDRIKIGDTVDFVFSEPGETMISRKSEAPIGGQRGTATSTSTEPPANGIWISPSAQIWREGKLLMTPLSRTEFRLLQFLIANPKKLNDYPTVARAIWGEERKKDSLHELIFRLRRKIEPNPASPKYILIRSGLGVIFEPDGI